MIRPIQYLRALAAMMIVWVHSLYIIPGMAERLGAPNFGGNGVDLFFVISGFVMVVTTVGKEVTPQRFFLRRIIRVVPLYWLATLAMIACAVAKHSFNNPYPPGAIAKSLLFFPYYSSELPRGVWPILQNGWTLNYEMFFYALFALSLAAPRRVRLPGLALTMGSLVVIGEVFGPFKSALALFYTSAFLLEFVAGMILAYGWLRNRSLDLPLLSAFLIVVGLYCIGSTHSRLIVMSGAFILVAGCLNPRICATQNRPLLELGDASYSIYLTHQFVLEALAWCWIRLIPLATWAWAALFMVLAPVLCALAGWLCYRFIERPLISQLRRLAKGSDPGSLVNGGVRELRVLPHSDP